MLVLAQCPSISDQSISSTDVLETARLSAGEICMEQGTMTPQSFELATDNNGVLRQHYAGTQACRVCYMAALKFKDGASEDQARERLFWASAAGDFSAGHLLRASGGCDTSQWRARTLWTGEVVWE